MGLLAASSVTGGPHLGRQCDAASISMLEMPAVAAAMPGDNRRSDPAMQMRLRHKKSAAGYGLRQCAAAASAAPVPARPDARRHARSPARYAPAGRAADVLAVEVCRRGIHPDRQRVRLQETEQRPQLVVDHQRMALAAPVAASNTGVSTSASSPMKSTRCLNSPGTIRGTPARPPPAGRRPRWSAAPAPPPAPLHRATTTAPASGRSAPAPPAPRWRAPAAAATPADAAPAAACAMSPNWPVSPPMQPPSMQKT